MENQGFIKQIKDKGNGQAYVYLDKKKLKENNLEIGDLVRITPK